MCGSKSIRLLAGLALALVLKLPALAQEQSAAEENSTEQLAKAAQNPIANLISVPFQFQSNFGVGPYHRPQGVLNFQPVVPITINDDWNLITRWVTPILSQPQLTPNDERPETWVTNRSGHMGDTSRQACLAGGVECPGRSVRLWMNVYGLWLGVWTVRR